MVKVIEKHKSNGIVETLKEKKFLILIATVFFVGYFFTTNAYCASADTSQIDGITKWIATWVSRVGVAVAFFGGIQTAFGFKNDDANAKTAGLKTLASGFMVFALCQSLDLFGIV
ncbi:hypothetical protein ACSXAS_15410 (plasmid) [Clostridium perfringens]|uniref:hypothetical protein n=1 Tax=Clostridium perfringens TaxID=1502 RepID=UPI002247A933|nr:hypothetical protein [Clostridium perfringens]MCX0386717.1 hypothetical protein [Clostridium perfringens]